MTQGSYDTSRYALLVDYEFCTGCHSCEVSCKKHLGVAEGQWGIKVFQYGPIEYERDRWDFTYLPFPTSLCDLCLDRVDTGRLPACVHNCPADVMQFGTIAELHEQLSYKPKRVLYSPK